jgi:hypothetical protein
MNLNSFMNKYFGPLPREYCVYFYALSIVFGIMFATSAVSITYFMIMHIKKVNTMFIINSVFILLNSFFVYLANRLLHTMCVKSI